MAKKGRGNHFQNCSTSSKVLYGCQLVISGEKSFLARSATIIPFGTLLKTLNRNCRMIRRQFASISLSVISQLYLTCHNPIAPPMIFNSIRSKEPHIALTSCTVTAVLCAVMTVLSLGEHSTACGLSRRCANGCCHSCCKGSSGRCSCS